MRVRLIKIYCAKYIDKNNQSNSYPLLLVIRFTTKSKFLKLKLLTRMDPNLFIEGGIYVNVFIFYVNL